MNIGVDRCRPIDRIRVGAPYSICIFPFGDAQFDPAKDVVQGRAHRKGLGRHGEAECPRRLQVDDELEFGRLQDRQVGELGALEYWAGTSGGLLLRTLNGDRPVDRAARTTAVRHCRSSRQPFSSVARALNRQK